MSFILINILFLLLFLFLSAFFSGSETALFSLTKSDVHRYSRSRNKRERSISHAMRDPQKVLITILIGNLFANIIVSVLSTDLLLGFSHKWGHFISIGVVTPLIIVFCEISPKVLSLHSYEMYSKRAFPLLRAFHVLFFPVRVLLLLISNAMIRLFGLSLEHKEITKEELDMAVDLGERDGVIDKDERAFIKNVLRFSRKDASNAMFPRNSAIFIAYGTPIQEAMKIFLKHGIIRAPVYRDDPDTVIGMVDSRDLMPYHLGYRKAKNINRFVKEIQFFPASRELKDLLNDFLSAGIQIAIIVDEYGGTAGVVTLNKILSELLGKKFTKWEDDYKPELRKVGDRVSLISGEMQIEDFNYIFDESLEAQESDSIAGYIIEKKATFPRRGEEIETDRHVLRVKYIKKNKIESIEVIVKEENK